MRHGLILAVVFLATAAAAHAQVRRVTVTVRGMSCPFCAFGVEKKLQAVPGVGKVRLTMKTGEAELRAARGRSIDLAAIPGAIRRAGFSPGVMEAEVSGQVRRTGEGYLLDLPDGAGALPVRPGGAKAAGALRAAAASKAPVTVRGVVQREEHSAPVLSASAVEGEAGT